MIWLFAKTFFKLCLCFCFFYLFLQLDESKDFEERRLIRAAMRDLRKRKRGSGALKCFVLCFIINNQRFSDSLQLKLSFFSFILYFLHI